MEDKLERIIGDISMFKDLNFDNPEVLEKFLDISDIKRDKHHICSIREYLNDDIYFKEQMSIFESLTSANNLEINVSCPNCINNCNYTVDPLFNFMALLFVINIHNRDTFLDHEEKKVLATKFFKHFSIKNGCLEFDLMKFQKLFTDFDLKITNGILSKNNTLNNLNDLIDAKDFIDTVENRVMNLHNEKIGINKPVRKLIKKKTKYYKNKHFIENELNKNNSSKKNDESKVLDEIWLAKAKISIDDFLLIGEENNIWDENRNIISQRGSLYGSGKVLLSSLSIALKNFAISETIDYKIVGQAFCIAFKIKIDQNTKEPYKSFISGNPTIIKQFKRLFRIQL